MKNTRLAAVCAVAATLLLPMMAHGQATTAIAGGCAPGDMVHPVSAHFVSIQPHPGFSPLTASNALLRCYGFPTRSTDPAQRRLWTSAMQRFEYVVPRVIGAAPQAVARQGEPALASHRGEVAPHRVRQMLRPHGQTPDWVIDNWTGYAIASANNGYEYFTKASAYWTVPTLQTPDQGAMVASWVGLGDGGDGPIGQCCIWQAGVQSLNGSVDPYNFWYEDWGCTRPFCPSDAQGNPTEEEITVNVPVRPGDFVFVAVDNGYGPPVRPASYFPQNYSTGQGTPLTAVSSVDNTDTGLYAEFIVEENGPCTPTGACTHPDLYGAFTDPSFYGAVASAGTDTRGLGGWTYTRVDLCNPNVNYLAAVPSAVGASNSFHISNYGSPGLGSC